MKFLFQFLLFNFLVIATVVLAEVDYYKVLGVSKDADEREIKKAYRVLSKKYHPDKNQNDKEAHDRFIEVSEAYDVLSDDEKRSVYDRYGADAVKNGGGDPRQQHNDPFGDIFAHMFGGGGGGGQARQQRKPRGNDIATSADFTLKEFYNGVSKDFEVEMQDICDKCQGHGSADGKDHTCDECNGRGIKIVKRQLAPGMFQQYQGPCNKCGGKGKIIKNKCKKCNGDGVHRSVRKHSLHVQPGTPRDYVEILEGEADHSPEWIAGDLRVQFREVADGNMGYHRVGKNLYRTEVLSLKEALYGGWEREIPFLDNYDNKLKISRPEGQMVSNGEVEIIKNKGMPAYNNEDEFGDLFVEYLVIFPGGNHKMLKNIRDEL
ncbi:hypothetical protein PACTADRAFT_51069 [Pachysolen tannophilus NRRL Y-2460]|uniref:J domain-containing protein n=1 Tax=Pachysolen tannophilus NRRL Y-2460 TaxID=669874 RepID=A0A1E4TR32_PACTA|nr:hypothetical protein PACTADRAFT_51069 [Pachysolen tannophilus NRRL Y-2460]